MKDLVLQRLLAFLQEQVPLSEAWCATLGGQGVEARLWQEAGIRPERGMLIERSTKLSRPLIARLPYAYYPRLQTFAWWWQRNRGDQGLDLLHLDLCGTLEPIIDTVREMLPLVSRSRGRCLAITVAEKRRNRSLETYELVRTRMHSVLGSSLLDHVEHHLLKEQERVGRTLGAAPTADPVKGMKREVGFLFCLTNLLVGPDGSATPPDCIERYAYHSRYGRRPCRMRTIFLHLGKVSRTPDAAQELTTRWLVSPLFVARDQSFSLLPTVVPAMPKRPRGRPRRSTEVPQHNGDPTVEMQLALLRAEAEGPDVLATVLGTVARELGLRGRTGRTRRILGALRSKMFDPFRPSFLRTAVAHCGDSVLTELAVLYSRLKHTPVTAQELRREAGIAVNK